MNPRSAGMETAELNRKRFFYDTIADRYNRVMNTYDLRRRVEIVFGSLISPEELRDKNLLDVGCGTGWFSQAAAERGAKVVSLDIGLQMLKQVQQKCASTLVTSDACHLCFQDESFDVVISSECIEHTPNPIRALQEMCRVLRPNGLLVVTVPNRIWRFSATIAAVFKLRPYDGLENWVGWRQIRRELERQSMRIDTQIGFHLFPPVLQPTWRFVRFMDRFGGWIGPVMLNIGVRARK